MALSTVPLIPTTEVPTPTRTIPANPTTVRSVLGGTSKWGALVPGDHIVLEDGLYEYKKGMQPIAVKRSGTQYRPIVIRAKHKGLANWRIPLGIKANHVWLWGLDLTNISNANSDTQLGGIRFRDTAKSAECCGIAVDGINNRVLRCKIDFTRFKDTTRKDPLKLQVVMVANTATDFKFMFNTVSFSCIPRASDAPPTPPPADKGKDGADPTPWFIRPLTIYNRETGLINNRNLEVAYNLFEKWPGNEFFDDVCPLISGKKLSAFWGYDYIMRGTVFSVSAEYNTCYVAKTQGFKIHHNLVRENGVDMDFGGVRTDGQGSCWFAHNSNTSGDGLRIRVSQNWVIEANYITNGRGLYGLYGRGHVFKGNYCEADGGISIRSGNCDPDRLATPGKWPPKTNDDYQEEWTWLNPDHPTHWSAVAGGVRPANWGTKWYGNKGKLYVGYDPYAEDTDVGHDVYAKNNAIYHQMDLDGNVQTDYNATKLVDGGFHTGTTIAANIPAGISVATARLLEASEVGMNALWKAPLNNQMSFTK